MATATNRQVNPDEYIGQSFHPDVDFVDGELQERNLGELEHSEVQTAILEWFSQYKTDWHIKSLGEIRIQTGSRRFRVADVAVLSEDAPRERIITTPPLIVIEILSPEDRVGGYMERLDDYREMGVKNIWVVDPMTLNGFDCSTASWNPADTFSAPNSKITLHLKRLDIRR